MEINPTPRAYTLRLSGTGDWRDRVWATHTVVNRGVSVWGDWLLTLRGGLPASLAHDHPERRVLLALSWMTVERSASHLPDSCRIVRGDELEPTRVQRVMERLRQVLVRQQVYDVAAWEVACKPAITARIREDAWWIDRSECFVALQGSTPGLTPEWAQNTVFELLGDCETYFELPNPESAAASDAKDFVQKAGGWLSRNWGSGEKCDSTAIVHRLRRLAEINDAEIVGRTGGEVKLAMIAALGSPAHSVRNPEALFKEIKRIIGWKGAPSMGAKALQRLVGATRVESEVWALAKEKLLAEAVAKEASGEGTGGPPRWMNEWRRTMEERIRMRFREQRDHLWEYGVMLDHALRRVSGVHSWIKRAEVDRATFQVDAAKIEAVPELARTWLDGFREKRSVVSGARGEYVIHRRALDAWPKVVQGWAALGNHSTREQRQESARSTESILSDNEKFGDIQLFEALAIDEAHPCWQRPDGTPDPQILIAYSAATVAEFKQRRFKVPAYCHPDPLRHPVFVDFGKSRWSISYSALKSAQAHARGAAKTPTGTRANTKNGISDRDGAPGDLRTVTLNLWQGSAMVSTVFRWHSKRFSKDLILPHSEATSAASATRGDRFGRVVAGTPRGAVGIANLFQEELWNGRLQAPRRQLDHLADLIYGKHGEPSWDRLDKALGTPASSIVDRSLKRLRWLLTASAKLQPSGPWLDYVARGLPPGVSYKVSAKGAFLNYVANTGRRGASASLRLARLPGLRILSVDLGHRYAAACAVWETLSADQVAAACRASGIGLPSAEQPFIHLRRRSLEMKAGDDRENSAAGTTIYRRIGPDVLPDGVPHPAPWARLDRQFLLRLPGEERPARFSRLDEYEVYHSLLAASGSPTDYCSSLEKDQTRVRLRIDELQAKAVRAARLGLRRLGNLARIAHAFTATARPGTGGQPTSLTTTEARVAHITEALMLWQDLAGDAASGDAWANGLWEEWVRTRLGGPVLLPMSGARLDRREKKTRIEEAEAALRGVAERLADPHAQESVALHELWSAEWERRSENWRRQLRLLRRLILPRIGQRPKSSDRVALERWKKKAVEIRRTGGLSLRRLNTVRGLYQVLKAFRMRPEPKDLVANVPAEGDGSLARFGDRILTTAERLREQRVKQLASRIVEAGLGVGSENRRAHWNGRKRANVAIPDRRFAPCEVVVIENLENYRPEETRLRRENRQLMNWCARNIRKHILEGCQLHGLYFTEVSPHYTSRQDSRTGAPGIRCEAIPRTVLEEAVREVGLTQPTGEQTQNAVSRLRRELVRLENLPATERSARECVLLKAKERLRDLPRSVGTILVPRQGGELFVSADVGSPTVGGIQADMNAAANIGLRSLMDPDWIGAWWFVLVDAKTGVPDGKRVEGCPFWRDRVSTQLLAAAEGLRKSRRGSRQDESQKVYAWRGGGWDESGWGSWGWQTTRDYWRLVEEKVVQNLVMRLQELETPW